MSEQKPSSKGKDASGDTARPPSGKGALSGLLSGPLGQRIALAAGGLSVLAMVISLSVAFWPRPPKPAPVARPLTLEDALTALDESDFAEARRMATQLRQNAAPDETGGPLFVLGAAAAKEADEFLGRERHDLFLLAANYLEEARHDGLPEGRLAEGLFLLGKSLNACGRYEESRAPLEEALQLDPAQGSALHWLLAAAYSKGEHRDIPKALSHIHAYLADPARDINDRYNGLLEQLRMHYQVQDVAGCEAVLAKIPREAGVYPEAELIRGRLAIRHAQQLKQQLPAEATPEQRQQVKLAYEEAIKILRRAQDDPLGTQAIRRSMYLIGICFLEMKDYPAALAQFERTRKVWLDTPEGMAAALEEAELLRRAGRNEDALATYTQLLGAAKDPFVNTWITPDKFRERVLAAFRQYLVDQRFEMAVALSAGFAPLFPPARADEYQAEALRAWAAKLLADADTHNEPEASELRRKGRELERKAGHLFEHLAQLEFSTRQYPDDLWRAAEAFLSGHDFRAAAATFEEYLKYETRRRRPRALVQMGESYLALNRLEDALGVCQECIDYYPTDAASYQARILTSKVFVEKGDYSAAEAILRENLNGDLLAPESKEWRESLFRLGELLEADGRYEEAIQRLREAVQRYPDTREAVRARYLIAESYRQLAKGVQEKLLQDTIETTRAGHHKELQKWLNAAIEYYVQVQATLNQRREKTPLSSLEKAILRNSYFAVGAAWFDLQQYENAIRAYSTVINRYQHDPEALEAFVQMAKCYRRWQKPVEARGTLQQAKLVLNRMKPDAPFAEVTNNTQREWSELLDWLSTF